MGWFSKLFELTKEMQATFKELKMVFTTMPILQHYNTNLPVWLETDISSFPISGILSQQVTEDDLEAKHWHPITF